MEVPFTRASALHSFSASVLFALLSQVQTFHFFSGPRGSSQEDQAGFDAGVFCEAVYPDPPGHLFPPVFFNQMREDHFKGDAVKRVFVFIIYHVFLKTPA